MSKYPKPYSKDSVFKRGARIISSNSKFNSFLESLVMLLFFLYCAILAVPSKVITDSENELDNLKHNYVQNINTIENKTHSTTNINLNSIFKK